MRLVYKFNIKQNDKIYDLCRISKNLYNQALYLVKKELKENNKWLNVNGALNIMRKVVGDSEIVSKIINSGCLFQPLRVNIL